MHSQWNAMSVASTLLNHGSRRYAGRFIPILLFITLIAMARVASATTYPANTTYYISTSGCNNSNPGTSSSAPWCDFTNVNANTFSQGDQILLHTGSSWSTGMAPLGSGASANPITIGCYGTTCSSNYPVINAGSSTPSIYLLNPSWWIVTNLTLTGSNDGLWCHFTQLGNQGLIFQNLYIYNLNGSSPSIIFDGYNANPPTSIPSGQYIISGVTFQNIGISNAGAINLTADYANAQQVNNGYPNAQQNILMKNITASNYKGCFGFANAENIIVMDSFWQQGDADGSCGAATYMVALSNTTFNNGIFYDDAFTNGSDNGAFVYDNQESQIAWRGAYFYKNSASGIEGAENLCFANCTSSTNSQFEVSSSTFYDNSTQVECTDPGNSSATYGFYGDISVAYSPETQMAVSNNLYSDTSQSCNAFVNRVNSSYQTLTNNINFSGSGLYNSASQFSGTQGQNQWTYEYWNGSAWWVLTPTYNSSIGYWNFSTGAWINQFDIQPDTCTSCWTARMWQAPSTGTVYVAGWVLKNTTGTAVQVGINHNGSWVWGNGSGSWYTLGANDVVGVATDATVSVTAGEYLVFVVGNQSGATTANAVVSWMPSITY
jgi:hypothetical protein